MSFAQQVLILLNTTTNKMIFEQTKTIAGSDVVIYQRGIGPFKMIHGAWRENEDWYVAAWFEDGCYHTSEPRALDLIESIKSIPLKPTFA